MMPPAQGRILLADDEPLYLNTTAELLRRAGFECETALDAESALTILSQGQTNLLIVDLNMPGNLDLELLNVGRRDFPQVPMIVATGAPSLRSAIDSVRLRIADYLLKPLKFEDLVASIRRALAAREQSQMAPRSSVNSEPLLLGDSPPMREILELIQRAAVTDANVLITGESGTGKELVAEALHRASHRQRERFVTIDCTSIPESLFESVLFGHATGAFTGATADQPGLLKGADGGTVFLDEIGELPLTSQAKLLRLIQHSTFIPVGQTTPLAIDVRFIAATNRDLMKEVGRERFRRDLFYRLAVVPIHLPPLRARGDDVAILARHFLRQFRGGVTSHPAEFSPEAIQSFRNYDWPGNVRELANVVERVAAFSPGRVIERSDLPEALREEGHAAPVRERHERSLSRGGMLTQVDRGYLEEQLRHHKGNVSLAASAAGLSRQGLYKLLRKHGINPQEFRVE